MSSCLAAAAAAWLGRVARGERDRGPTAGEDAVMGAEVPDEVEVRGEARVGKHAPGIAANREHLAGLDEMVPVKFEGIERTRHGALINHRLAVILASGLDALQLE